MITLIINKTINIYVLQGPLIQHVFLAQYESLA